MPDVQGKLDEIITMVETAKGKALSGSAAVIDRAALLAALEEMRQLLPAEMSEARSLLRERNAVQDAAREQADELLASARAEADRTIDAARDQRDRLVSESEVVEEADRLAAEITGDAQAQATRMREQTDEYIDASLARFEQLLNASLETVTRGRDRVAAAREQASAAARYDAAADAAEESYGGVEGSGDNGYASGEGMSWESDDPPVPDSSAAASAS